MNTIATIIAFNNSDVTIGGADFWDQGIGRALATLMGVIGLIVVVIALLNVVKNIAGGKIGQAVKGVIGAIILAVFLFNPQLINTSIRAASGFVNSGLETIQGIGDSGNENPGSGGSGDGSGSGGGQSGSD